MNKYPKKIQFWFEFASTYSYLSIMRIEKLISDTNIELEWCPFLLGPIIKNFGWTTSPFNIYKEKGKHMWRDIERHCEKYNIPFKKPSVFPRNGLLAARVAIIGLKDNWGKEFAKKAFLANFSEDRDIQDPAVLGEILSSLQVNSEKIITLANTEDNKNSLKQLTDTAMDKGIFGAPTFIVDGELFWGNDRLEDAIEFANRS